MTEAEAMTRAELIWPGEAAVLRPLDSGDWVVDLIGRPRHAVHIIDADGKARCHEDCKAASRKLL